MVVAVVVVAVAVVVVAVLLLLAVVVLAIYFPRFETGPDLHPGTWCTSSSVP